MPNEVSKGIAFILLSIGLIALAGPLPTIVNSVLVLVLSGVILSRYVAFEDVMNWITQQLSSSSGG